MILKRKTESTQIKSKEKHKQPKQTKQTKKPKKEKEHSQRIKAPSSKKVNKTSHLEKQQHHNHHQQNQNINRSNLPLNYVPLPPKMKVKEVYQHQFHQIDILPMRRSASAGGIKLVRHIRKSLSPALSKQTKDKSDIKHKYSSKPTSRSEKQKAFTGLQYTKSVVVLKKQAQGHNQKPKITRKKSQKIIKNQSLRQKTDNSQKIHEQIAQREQKKEKSNKIKNGKNLKSKELSKTTSKSKLKIVKHKQNKKNQVIFSEVSFHDSSPIYSAIAPRQNFYIKMEKNEENKVVNACITIQRHMRGYLTRKYIQQSKFMVYCAIKIQKVWRGYLCRKRMRKNGLGKKNLSIENSLITIKDFSEDHKQEKLKNKSFRFSFQSDTKKKQDRQDGSSLKKQYEQNEKYINVLESLLLEQGLEQKYKQKIRTTLGKQKYVQRKIQSEIISEKSFNSPRQLRSPKSSVIMNSPTSWSKSKQFTQNHLQNVCTSPRRNEVSEIISKRVSSPLQTKEVPHEGSGRRLHKNSEVKQERAVQVKPLETSMQFIEQIQLRIVDYLRDYNLIEVFLQICKRCQNFRTYLIIEQWNKSRDYNEQQINFLHQQICPDIFPITFRQEVITNNKICLEDNNYIESLWLNNPVQRFVYEAYIKFIFDCVGEAIYDNYKLEVVTKRSKGRVCYYQGHDLFTNVITNGLTLMQAWSQYMCGAEIPVPQDDPNYKLYCEKNRERTQLMIKQEIKDQNFSQNGCFTFWLQLALSQQILQTLVAQLWDQIIF